MHENLNNETATAATTSDEACRAFVRSADQGASTLDVWNAGAAWALQNAATTLRMNVEPERAVHDAAARVVQTLLKRDDAHALHYVAHELRRLLRATSSADVVTETPVLSRVTDDHLEFLAQTERWVAQTQEGLDERAHQRTERRVLSSTTDERRDRASTDGDAGELCEGAKGGVPSHHNIVSAGLGDHGHATSTVLNERTAAPELSSSQPSYWAILCHSLHEKDGEEREFWIEKVCSTPQSAKAAFDEHNAKPRVYAWTQAVEVEGTVKDAAALFDACCDFIQTFKLNNHVSVQEVFEFVQAQHGAPDHVAVATLIGAALGDAPIEGTAMTRLVKLAQAIETLETVIPDGFDPMLARIMHEAYQLVRAVSATLRQTVAAQRQDEEFGPVGETELIAAREVIEPRHVAEVSGAFSDTVAARAALIASVAQTCANTARDVGLSMNAYRAIMGLTWDQETKPS